MDCSISKHKGTSWDSQSPSQPPSQLHQLPSPSLANLQTSNQRVLLGLPAMLEEIALKLFLGPHSKYRQTP